MDKAIVAVDTTAGHYGSLTVKTATGDIKRNHDKYWFFTSDLYPAMWGGGPNREKYIVPFNGADSVPIIEGLKRKHGID